LLDLHGRRGMAIGPDRGQATVRDDRGAGRRRAHQRRPGRRPAAAGAVPVLLDRRALRPLHRAAPARVRAALEDAGRRRAKAGLAPRGRRARRGGGSSRMDVVPTMSPSMRLPLILTLAGIFLSPGRAMPVRAAGMPPGQTAPASDDPWQWLEDVEG